VVQTQDGRVNRRAATLDQKALRRSIAIAAQPRLVHHFAAYRPPWAGITAPTKTQAAVPDETLAHGR
jgi:hypothetical protein